ncbi:SUF system Fe-S cluster assembly regulator [Polymorphobacter multimanifer]|uniref:FeS assembly SUF system regulator n=1 Tax=Polymorphobacter multimanifer TaxID=1070431 RepID=A0A841L3U8_9SPHN|nr:SUF system Fe-S cluster assembly regulator [Polymorphobacter multimanifer]MBB6227100.1 FeS assembly SUF system regulator [Polymorphobacter multimanifer]GGI70479.1 SUF system Fe-S cluster assembly regulator [Polymorphobacter multimanifer]
MIRLTNLADYAVVLMTAVAREPEQRFSSARAAEVTTIPAPTVAKLLGTLARGGLLLASRGVAGGFVLARPAAEISIAAIVETVDGPISLTACVTGEAHDCVIEGVCGVRGHWGPINAAVRAALEAVSLADLLKKPAATACTTRELA